VEVLGQVRGLHGLAVVLEGHAAEGLPLLVEILLRWLLVALEELWLAVQVQRCLVLPVAQVVSLDGLVDLVVAGGVLALQGVRDLLTLIVHLSLLERVPVLLLRRHLVEVLGEPLVIKIEKIDKVTVGLDDALAAVCAICRLAPGVAVEGLLIQAIGLG